MKLRILAPALLAAGMLAACNNAPPPPPAPNAPDAPGAPQTALGRTVEKAMAEARQKLASENISLNRKDGGMHIGRHGVGSDDPNLPRAEITPQGDFLLDGKTIAIDDAQRKLLLDYRGHVIEIASIGMSLGTKGADLGMRAAGEAMKGIFTGNTEQIGKNIEAEAEKLKAEAQGICRQLTPLLAAQDALAASLPEFKPYARMEQSDIDDCMKDGGTGVFTGNAGRDASRAQVRSDIRDGIRQSIRGAVQSAGLASSGTGDVINANGVRFLLPPGGVDSTNENGNVRIDVSNGLRVRLDDNGLHVNGERYAAPRANGEVDLREGGIVRVDGQVVAPLN